MHHALQQHNDMLLDSEYRLFQLNRIRLQVKILGSLAAAALLLMLPWDLQSDSPDRALAVALRMVAILQFFLILLVWQSPWLERHFVSVLMLLGLVSFLCLCGNYIVLPERTPYLYTILFYYSVAFLVLAPLAGSGHIIGMGIVPLLLVYACLASVDLLETYFTAFTLHSLPLLLILNIGAWYIRRTAQDHYRLYRMKDELATFDSLTGLFNRHAWESRTGLLLARANRERHALAVLLADVDNFKRVNDTWGHLAGDEVLRQLATCLKRTMREYDVLGRYGGEEFVICVAGLDTEKVEMLAERVRREVDRHVFSLPDGTELHITLSIGVACLRDGNAGVDTLLDLSDKALYQAKQLGRNCVVVSQEPDRRRLPNFGQFNSDPEPAC